MKHHAPGLQKTPVAYFSAEFGLHESLRIYSGGLGILAGDHSKSASDLGLPFYGITLLYRQGYFQQQISNDGWQMERYPTYDPARLPIRPVKDKHGKPVVCSVEIGNDTVLIQGWAVQVGRTTIFLLDTDLPENDKRFRDLTAHVYGGDQWTRIGQEIVLGIGGVRFLRALGISPRRLPHERRAFGVPHAGAAPRAIAPEEEHRLTPKRRSAASASSRPIRRFPPGMTGSTTG